jgi:hypothetical protein
MIGYKSILIILLGELLIFITEIILASVFKKNKALKKANPFENNKFIDLKKGFRTNISIFRFSLFLVYIILIVLFFNSGSDNFFEELILYILAGALIYMVSVMNSKIFVFYESYFIVSSPFNPLRKNLIVNYNSIEDYHIYRALYNSFYLKIVLKDSTKRYIHFSGAYLPKNDLALKVILKHKTNIEKEIS